MMVRTGPLGAGSPSTSASARRRFLASLTICAGVGVVGDPGLAGGGAPSPSEERFVDARPLPFLALSDTRRRVTGMEGAAGWGRGRGSGGKGSKSSSVAACRLGSRARVEVTTFLALATGMSLTLRPSAAATGGAVTSAFALVMSFGRVVSGVLFGAARPVGSARVAGEGGRDTTCA